MKKILHIASENYAGVPFALVKTERLAGIQSDIVTLMPSKHGHPQEQSLKLPFFTGRIVDFLRFGSGSSQSLDNTRYTGDKIPPVWNPSNWAKILFNLRDFIWTHTLSRHSLPESLENYDTLVLDGGIGLLRSGKHILNWNQRSDNLITVYYGSELRKRGVIPQIDKAAKYVFTFEFDHTLIHPRARFMFYPFFCDEMPVRNKISDGKIRIGHSPTKRSTKGTDIIVAILEKICKKFPHVEIIVIENLPYREALREKSKLDIFIDQLGELGYGISGLEAMAMGIPVATEIMPDFDSFLGEHPFIKIDAKTLEMEIIKFLENPDLRIEFGERGLNWLKKYHYPLNAIEPLLDCYRKENLL